MFSITKLFTFMTLSLLSIFALNSVKAGGDFDGSWDGGIWDGKFWSRGIWDGRWDGGLWDGGFLGWGWDNGFDGWDGGRRRRNRRRRRQHRRNPRRFDFDFLAGRRRGLDGELDFRNNNFIIGIGDDDEEF